MEENSIYQTPEADVQKSDISNEFYVVSGKKFLLLYFFTLGLYTLVWFYIHWRRYSRSNKKKMWPVMRAIFSIFFAHSLFKRICDAAIEKKPDLKWNHQNAATIYVLFAVAGSILDRLSYKSIGTPTTDILSILTLLVTAPVIYKAQMTANVACQDEFGLSNKTMTPINILWIVLGGLIWLVALIGFYDIFFGFPGFE